MSKFKIRTFDTAPGQSVRLLESAQQSIGFAPNLMGVLAESITALAGYLPGRTYDEGI